MAKAKKSLHADEAANASQSTAVAVAEPVAGGALATVDNGTGDLQGTASGGLRAPYIRQATSNPKDPNVWAAYVREVPGVQLGDMLACMPDGSKILLKPTRGYILRSHQYWAVSDQNNGIIQAFVEKPPGTWKQLKDQKIDEHVDGVMLIHVPGHGLTPVTFRVRGGAVRGFLTAATEARKSTEPDWGDKSPAHKAALGIGNPKFRVIATITAGMGTAKTTGNGFAMTNATCSPNTGVEDIAALKAFNDDAKNADLMRDVYEVDDARKQDVLSKVK